MRKRRVLSMIVSVFLLMSFILTVYVQGEFLYTNEGTTIVQQSSKEILVKGNIYYQGYFDNSDMLKSYPLDDFDVYIYQKEKYGDKKIGKAYTDKSGNFSTSLPCPANDMDIYFIVKAEDPYSYVKKDQAEDIIQFSSNAVNTRSVVNNVLDFGSMEAVPGTAFDIVKIIRKGARFFVENTKSELDKIPVFWDENNFDRYTYYQYSPFDRIVLSSARIRDTEPSAILHEYGHYVMHKTAGFPKDCEDIHTLKGRYNPRLAYSEGWASFFSEAVLDSPIYYQGAVHAEEPIPDVPYEDNEVAVNAVLWDLLDTGSEDYSEYNFSLEPSLPVFKYFPMGDKINSDFADIANTMKALKTPEACPKLFYKQWMSKYSGEKEPYDIWQIFQRHGMAKYDDEPPAVNSINIKNPTISSPTVIEADVQDNIKVAAVAFFVNGNYYSSDLEEPFTCTIDPSKFKSGNYTLTARAFDFVGNSRGSIRNILWDNKENTNNDLQGENEFFLPYGEHSETFIIEYSTGTDNYFDNSLQKLEKSILDNGYKKLSSNNVKIYSGVSTENIPFNAKKGYDYNLMIESGQGSFDLEIYRPDGTLFEKVKSPCSPYGVELKNCETGTWTYKIIPVQMPESTALVAYGVGEKLDRVTLNDFKKYNKEDNITIRGESGASKVVLTIKEQDGNSSGKNYSADVINGCFEFEKIPLALGKNLAVFKGLDSDNKEGESYTTEIVYDNTAPELTINSTCKKPRIPVSEMADTSVYDDKIYFDVSVDEDVRLTINGEDLKIVDWNAMTVKSLATGNNTFEFVATDKASNVSTKTLDFKRIGNYSFEEEHPQFATKVDENNTVYVEVEDANPVLVEAYLQGIKLINKGNNYFSIDDTKVSDGSYNIIVKVQDLWGNTSGSDNTIVNVLSGHLVTVTPSETPTNYLHRGDVNQDGKVDSADYTILRRYLIRKIKLFGDGLKCSDMNGDGKVDSADFTLLRRELLK